MTADNNSIRFLMAAGLGDIGQMQQALSRGADINVSDRGRRNAVLLASINQHYDGVAWLIDNGADINQQDDICINPFLHSCLTNDLTLLRLLLPAGPDLTRLTRFGGVGLTPACEKGHLEVVRELLTCTAINVNHTNFVGWTPLLEAIVLNDGGERQQQIIALLLAHGANPHMTDKYGKTPLALAKERGFDAIARLLVDAGAA